MRTCVIYYSLEGNTKEAAQAISQALGADLIPIIPCKAMPANRNAALFLGGFQASFGLGGPICPLPQDLKQYEAIILGTPVWAGKPAAPVQRFLKEYPAADKIAGVFTFSGSGSSSRCLEYLKKKGCSPRAVTALADRKSEKSSQNAEKLRTFLESLQKERD